MYEELLLTLLMKQKYDFTEVQPAFNMILADINKKLMKVSKRFEVN